MLKVFRTNARRFASNAPMIATPLLDLHKELGGQIIEFAGYALPVQYKGLGVKKEHVQCRESAALFDVSHMGQLIWTGKDRIKFLEKMSCGDIAGLKEGQARLTVLSNDEGNALDDTIITNMGDYVYQVVNGSTKHADMAHFKKHMSGFDVQMEYIEDMALVALQGPKASEILKKYTSIDQSKDPFMSSKLNKVNGIDCRVSRCGYTGEDGYEIAIPESKAIELCKSLLEHKDLDVAGLGARDSLRLEAGLCLYGQDLHEEMTLVESGLNWLVGKRRRAEANFLGAKTIVGQLNKEIPLKTKRVGLIIEGPPARRLDEVHIEGVGKVGFISSGCWGPTIDKPIAMALTNIDVAKVDSYVHVKVRGKLHKAKVVKMPFVETHYYK